MSEEKQNEQQQNAATEAVEKHFDIQRIYIKDVSFETPNSPKIFLQEWKPKIDFQLGTEGHQLDKHLFEVALRVTVTSKVEDNTAFLAEVEQAGIFTIKGFSEQEMPHMIGSYCPNILFPYVREVISDLVVKGGFPSFLMAPVNFDAILSQHMQQAQAEQEAGDQPQH